MACLKSLNGAVVLALEKVGIAPLEEVYEDEHSPAGRSDPGRFRSVAPESLPALQVVGLVLLHCDLVLRLHAGVAMIIYRQGIQGNRPRMRMVPFSSSCVVSASLLEPDRE
jgi:hypothetical protein